MPAVLPKSLNTKSNFILRRQFVPVVAIFCQKFVFGALKIPLLLISNCLCQQNSSQKHTENPIDEVERFLMGKVDGSGEPLDEDNLIVGNEKEVEKFHQYPVIILTDVGPSIVLASAFESSLPGKVVCMFDTP